MVLAVTTKHSDSDWSLCKLHIAASTLSKPMSHLANLILSTSGHVAPSPSHRQSHTLSLNVRIRCPFIFTPTSYSQLWSMSHLHIHTFNLILSMSIPSTTARVARECQYSRVAPIVVSLPRSLWPHDVAVCVRSFAQGSVQRRWVPQGSMTRRGKANHKTIPVSKTGYSVFYPSRQHSFS